MSEEAMIPVPACIVEEWLPLLSPIGFKVAVYLAVRRGWERPGFPAKERHRLADAIGRERVQVYPVLNGLEALGVLVRDGDRLLLNSAWDPDRAPWDLLDHLQRLRLPRSRGTRE